MAGNIRVYDTPRLGLSPNERASDALAQQARTTGALYDRAASSYNRIGDSLAGGIRAVGQVADDYIAHREISSGGMNYAKMQSSLQKAWDETISKSDPNDGEVAERFQREVVEPTLEEFGKGFWSERGQNWARSRVQSFRDHMGVKTAADMSTMAGIALETNLTQSINAYTNTVRTDPSSLKSVMEAYRSQVDAVVATSPNLRGVAGAKARMSATQKGLEAIVQSAISSAIDKNPQAGLEMAKDPELMKYVGGKDIKAFEREARSVERERREDQRWSMYLQDKQRKEASESLAAEYEASIYTGDKPITHETVRKDETLEPSAKVRLHRIIEREQKPETVANKSRVETAALLKRMRAPEGDPEKITTLDPLYEAYIDNKITRPDFESLKREYAESRTPEGGRLTARTSMFMQQYRKIIEKPNSLGQVDAADQERAYFFEMDLMRRMDAYRKAGKDPYDLLDPAKPDFFGSAQNLMQYQRSAEQRLQDMQNVLATKSPSGWSPPPVPNAKVEKGGAFYLHEVYDPELGKHIWMRTPRRRMEKTAAPKGP